MITVKSVSESYEVESQYSEEVTEMVNITFTESRSSGGDQSTAAVEKALGVGGLGLGGERQVTKAFKATAVAHLPVGKTLDLHINREWCSENPYPKAVDSKGKPLAQPVEDIMCPDGQKRDLYSRTFISETTAPDAFDISEDVDVMNAPDAAETTAANPGKGNRVVRERG